MSRTLKGEEEEGGRGAKEAMGGAALYGMTETEEEEEESSEASVVGGFGRRDQGQVQFFSDNVIRRSGGTSQAGSTDSEMVHRSSGTGSSIG